MWTEERGDVDGGAREAAAILTGSTERWVRAAREENLDKAWEIFCDDAEALLLWRTEHALEGPVRSYLGRGVAKKPRQCRATAHQGPPELGAATVRQRELHRVVRRAEELHRQRRRLAGQGRMGAAPETLALLWNRLRGKGAKLLPATKWTR